MVGRIFPVITLYQPWATWIMRGWKTIETRTHNRLSTLNGQMILIHAGLSTDASAVNNQYLTPQQIKKDPLEMVNGFILGSAFVYNHSVLNENHSLDALIDCHNTTRYGLFLKDVIKFEKPIPASGERGIWYYDLLEQKKCTKPKTQTNQTNLIL